MQRSDLWFLITYVGVIAIAVLFNAVAYRVGHFRVLAGEPRRHLFNIVLALAIGIALGVAVPRGTRLLGSGGEWVIILLGLGSVALLLFSRRWRKGWLERILQRQPPEVQSEAERRAEFFRGRQGRLLFFTAVLSILIWLVVTNFLLA